MGPCSMRVAQHGFKRRQRLQNKHDLKAGPQRDKLLSSKAGKPEAGIVIVSRAGWSKIDTFDSSAYQSSTAGLADQTCSRNLTLWAIMNTSSNSVETL